MGDLTLQQVVLRIGAVLLIASVHGFAIAATACALGDPGPRHDDRLSLNPLRHVDPLGGLLAVLFTVGWIRPIAMDPGRLRPGAAGLLAVVACRVMRDDRPRRAAAADAADRAELAAGYGGGDVLRFRGDRSASSLDLVHACSICCRCHR